MLLNTSALRLPGTPSHHSDGTASAATLRADMPPVPVSTPLARE
jgi:hypothetical protein